MRRALEKFPLFSTPGGCGFDRACYYSTDLIRRTRVTLVPSAGRFVVVLVIPNLASQN